VFAIGISLLHFLSPILKESVPMGLRKQGAKADVEKASENVSDFPILQVSLKVPAQAVVHFGGIPPISSMTGKSGPPHCGRYHGSGLCNYMCSACPGFSKNRLLSIGCSVSAGMRL